MQKLLLHSTFCYIISSDLEIVLYCFTQKSKHTYSKPRSSNNFGGKILYKSCIFNLLKILNFRKCEFFRGNLVKI